MSRLGLPHHDPSGRFVDEPTPGLGDIVEVDLHLGLAEVGDTWLRTVVDGEQEWISGRREGSRVRFELPCTQDVVGYRFHLDTAGGPRWLNGSGLADHDPTDADDFRLITSGRPPTWLADGVWYQIFPDRFATSGRYRPAPGDPAYGWAEWASWDDPVVPGVEGLGQMYGGDLDGITSRLDHLVGLGVRGIYLNPVFPAPSNHRYDASSFDGVDPLLGGDEALVRLSRAARSKGIRVMTDLTLNHVGSSHEWFLAAQADADAPEAQFFFFDRHPDRYRSWLGIDSLPKLDHRSAELRTRYYDGPDSVLARYLQEPFGMAGWRIDVANMTGRLGSLDLNHEVAAVARATVDGVDPERWLVGEHFFDATRDAGGDGWHGVMNYAGVTRPIVSWLGEFTSLSAFMPGPGQPPRDGVQMARSMDAIRAATAWQVTVGSMTLLGSHDTARWRSMARSDELAMVGLGMLMTLPGTPSVLYGDEVGLHGPTSETTRVPMPWDHSAWDATILATYRSLISLRSTEPALRDGGFRWAHVEPDAVIYLRETRDERLLVRAARASTRPVAFSTAELGAEELEPLWNAERIVTDASGVVHLPGDGPGCAIWRLPA